ncbi:uncharacterized protein LOC122509979 [Leptopilina heterotoma]|uniref:uncharacterized protein LOC122509979 n=1 Tax=Leptopilina heterotoma TaxID=63436 RepID=UPI001CAA1096|nr:uncharacterized protein LOC122509979 [Leptopilina heterotoma]
MTYFCTSHLRISNPPSVSWKKTILDLTPWLAEVGLSISPGKSQLTIFTRSNENFENCFIEIENSTVTAQSELTYLGIILDRKLGWQKHVREISQKATKTLNVIKSMSRISWGASPSSLLTVFKGLTRSHLEWGSQFFAESAQNGLRSLDRIQNQALRTILGCMRSTPIGILLSEANIPPLSLRRSLINRRHMIRNLSWTLNPLFTKLQCLQNRINLNNQNSNPSPIIRLPLLTAFGDVSQIMSRCGRIKKPSLRFEMTWNDLIRDVDVDLQIGLEIKSHVSPAQAFSELLLAKYEDFTDIYTDGSHDPVKSTSGASFVIPKLNINFSVRLSGLMLIDTCELYAILSAVKEAVQQNLDNILIISDSQNALNEIKYRFINPSLHPLLKRIMKEINALLDRGSLVSFIWIPSHSGIRGNELADGWARNALSLPFGNLQGGPPGDLLRLIGRDYEHWLNLTWPYSFSTPLTNKYFNHITVKTKRPWFRGVETSRRNINTITRLRTSHICTGEHFARMGWTLPLECPCGNDFKSLIHLFKNCPLLSAQRPAL